jgi:hypothetical protein
MLEKIPQLFFDLIARLIPGFLVLLIIKSFYLVNRNSIDFLFDYKVIDGIILFGLSWAISLLIDVLMNALDNKCPFKYPK